MNACPNPASAEWKALVNHLESIDPTNGLANAYTVYNLNGYDIPSFEKADQLLKELRILERDEQESRESNQKKIVRIEEQIQVLKTAAGPMSNANIAQTATIAKLIEMLDKYKSFLVDNITAIDEGRRPKATVSVTKYTGSSDFKGDPKLYEAYKHFGTFVHELVEKLQKEVVFTGDNIKNIFDEKFFEKAYNDFSDPFAIQNLDKKEMFNMTLGIVDAIQNKNISNFIILPEISVIGETKDGTKIIGRLDLMMIDSMGRIHVYDFKTKKITTKDDSPIPLQGAMVHLANKTHNVKTNEKGTGDYFKTLQNRSTYDTWMIQLGSYENMLLQNGLEVYDKRVLALLYQTNRQGVYIHSLLTELDEKHFYDYTKSIDLPRFGYSAREWFTDEEAVAATVKNISKAINIEIPVESKPIEDEVKEQSKSKTTVEHFNPTQKSLDNFAKILETVSSTQITNAYKELEAAKKENDPVRESIIRERIKSLKRFAEISEKLKEKTTEDKLNMLYANNFHAARTSLETSVKLINDITNKALEVYERKGKSFLESEKTKALTEIREAYNNAIIYDEILVAMEEIINELSRVSPENKEIFFETRNQLADLRAMSQSIQSNFKHVGLINTINLVQSLGTKTFERMEQQLNYALDPKIKQLELDIERLKEKSNLGILKTLKLKSFMLLNKDYRDQIKELMGPDGDIIQAEIIKLETEKQKLEWAKMGYSYSEDAIRTIVNGITNHDSFFYPGMQNPLAGDTLISGWNMDTMIASANNSDVMIGAMVRLLKDAKSQAEYEAMSDPGVQQLAKIIEDLREKGFTTEQMDSIVSETVDTYYYDHKELDPNVSKIKKQKRFTMVLPYTEEYANTYLEGEFKRRELTAEVERLKTEYSKVPINDPQRDVKFNEYVRKKRERDQHVKNITEWKVKNCTLEYSDEMYNLLLKIPQDLKDQLEKLYLDQNRILFSIGITDGNLDPVMLSEDDYLDLKRIQFDIKELKLKAKEMNPEYAKYIEEFDEFYEVETDIKNYQRLKESAEIKYSDRQDLMDTWLKEHSVQRPKKEWYDEIAKLYEAREKIYAGDPRIKELTEQKNRILKPYKQSGRLDPRFFTDEEIRELDSIEGEIEQIIEENQNLGLFVEISDDEKDELTKINTTLKRLVAKSLSPIYLDDYKTKTQILRERKDDLRKADILLNKLQENNAPQSEIDAAIEDYNIKERNFFNEEQQYAAWYDRYHVNSYAVDVKTIYMSEDTIDINKVPKGLNYERLPSASVAKDYMETVPNPVYYKVKTPRIGNWTLVDPEDPSKTRKLSNKEIEELKLDPARREQLRLSGRLIMKPGAYNPRFKSLQPINGIPLPKELILDFDANQDISDINSKHRYTIDSSSSQKNSGNVNPKYIEIYNNPDYNKLYFSTLNKYLGLQKELEGNVIGYNIPGMASTFSENLDMTGSLKDAIGTSINVFIDKNLKRDSQQDAVENIYGDLGSKVRNRFSRQLDEKIQTKGALNAIVKWTSEAHMAKAMQTVSPISTTFIDFMKTKREELSKQKLQGDPYVEHPYLKDKSGKPRKIKINLEKKIKEFDNFINIIEFENNKILYGITETDQNRKAKKVANAFFAYTSFIRIGFDLTNQVKNFVSGNVQAYLAATNFESSHYSLQDYYAGARKFGEFLNDFFKDYGKISDLHYNTMLYRMMNPAQKDNMKYFQDIVTGRKKNLLKSLSTKAKNDIMEFAYLMQDKGDTQIAVTVMYAVMNHYKYKKIKEIDANGNKIYELDKDGKPVLVSAHEAYIADNGTLIIDPSVEYTKEDETYLRNVIYSEVRRAQGNYAKIDQTSFEGKILGRVIFFFKKFLVPQFLNRFGHMRPNWEDGGVSMGYWRATWNALFNLEGFSKGRGLGTFFLKTGYFLAGESILGMKTGLTMRTYTIKDAKTGKATGKIDVGDFYAKHVAHARKDMYMMLLLTWFSTLALGFVKRKDDDDEELDMLTGNMIRVLWGVKGETVSMMPVGQGSNEYIKNFTTAIPFVREFTSMKNLVNHGFKTGILMANGQNEQPDEDWEDIWKEAYYSRKTGRYETGDSKLAKDIADLIPFYKTVGSFFNPQEKIDISKKTQ